MKKYLVKINYGDGSSSYALRGGYHVTAFKEYAKRYETRSGAQACKRGLEKYMLDGESIEIVEAQ